jgi:2-oxoglutarate dehydrogenase E2 component (dihydrolipoamide succinyltransferase)
MAVEIKVPSVGESITEGTIARWLKKDGAPVRADEPLFELETEKATTEVAAPTAGTLRITVQEGQTVAIGSVVGRIEEGAVSPPPAPVDAKKEKAGKPAPVTSDGSDKAARGAVPSKKEAIEPAAAPARAEVLLSPAARRLAEEEGLDVRQLKGTGSSGRITKEDVLGYLEQRRAQPQKPAAEPPSPKAKEREPVESLPPPPARAEEKKGEPPTAPRETRQRMSSIRQRIAERLIAAQQTAAILTTFNEADMSAVMALRNQYKDAFREKHGVGLGFMSFFVKAAIEALRTFPVVNAWIDGPDVVSHSFYNIGVAVSTERGLMVPVLRDADRLSFADIEKRIAELAQKARDGKITVDDLQGGTFTITNGGVFGSLLSTPILNPPQSAILGMHAIQKRPVAVNDQVVIRPMMYLALSYDHRLIDGQDAVLFLVRIKECIENPERLLLEV